MKRASLFHPYNEKQCL